MALPDTDFGTRAHSVVMAYPNEEDAFRRCHQLFPEHSVLLVGTYETLAARQQNYSKPPPTYSHSPRQCRSSQKYGPFCTRAAVSPPEPKRNRHELHVWTAAHKHLMVTSLGEDLHPMAANSELKASSRVETWFIGAE